MGGGWLSHALAVSPPPPHPTKKVRCWFGPTAGLDGYGKSSCYRISNPEPTRPHSESLTGYAIPFPGVCYITLYCKVRDFKHVQL
jgi:hypothetical protein